MVRYRERFVIVRSRRIGYDSAWEGKHVCGGTFEANMVA